MFWFLYEKWKNMFQRISKRILINEITKLTPYFVLFFFSFHHFLLVCFCFEISPNKKKKHLFLYSELKEKQEESKKEWKRKKNYNEDVSIFFVHHLIVFFCRLVCLRIENLQAECPIFLLNNETVTMYWHTWQSLYLKQKYVLKHNTRYVCTRFKAMWYIVPEKAHQFLATHGHEHIEINLHQIN